ncbi:hypothetical protein [Ideonella paludis]|uniref:Transmembrane protein n=1 Tax=Ideonella paludis TaxID=1233411 RepID=A0ABS5E080_9BURK|nr:hypothetical protein [Ideonella paludis]MBQ0936822.1 hypothetical protein [Ideonella paludis]
MYIVAIAWMFVVVLMAAAEATSSQGSVLGALITFLMYGALPLGLVLYIMGTPMRRQKRAAREAQDQAALAATSATPSTPPHSSRMAAGDTVPPEGKEP